MDTGIDLKLLLQIGSVLVAIIGAMAVARQQLKSLSEDFDLFRETITKKLGSIANDLDKVENAGISFESEIRTRLKVISGILSVERLESQHRELEKLHAADDVAQIRLDRLRSDLENFRGEYLSSHNNAHKYVPTPKYD